MDHLEKLPIFSCAARMESFRQAAKALGITQPALSRTIKALESAVGVELFVRQVRGARLTRQGQIFLQQVDRLLADIEDVEIRMRSAGDFMAGKLNIGTFESIAIYFWPGFLKRLASQYPNLSFSLSTVDEKEHLNRLLQGRLQLVVNVEPPPRDGIFSTILYEDRFAFYSVQKRPGERPPLIYVPQAVDRDGKGLSHHLKFHAQPFRSFYELDTFEAVKALAVKGLGTAILPTRVAESAVRSGSLKLVSVEGFPPSGFASHRICASVQEENRKSPRLRQIIQILKQSLDSP